MKYLVAVSGGVDSVVLLDMLVSEGQHELVVAHFDHGIRNDSGDDARFVGELAEKYHLEYEIRHEALGRDASEELARERRYAFLRDVASKHTAIIVTAHHADDLIETVALNLGRGTGWRGVAVLDSSDVSRPLLSYTKEQLYEYAVAKRLEWVEDSTNASDVYLRNRLRRRIFKQLSSEERQMILKLWKLQIAIKREIDNELEEQLKRTRGRYSKYFFTHIDSSVAIELLRSIAVMNLGHSITRPQLERALLAIKTAKLGKVFPFGGAQLVIGKQMFSLSVKTP